jgi:LacI family transcriptional regulator
MKKTIVEVAKELNLSPSTISKIVNGKGRISEETRQRVLQYVKESGYVAMSSARILSSKKSWTIGVVYSDISLIGFEHPFFSRILQAFKNEVERNGYEIVLIVSKLGDHELTYLEWCKNKKVDGVLIVMGNVNNPNIIQLVSSDIPCISTDIVMSNLESVISDDFQGVKIYLEYAKSHGYQKIGIVSGPLSARSFYNRLEAYRILMDQMHMPYEEDHIVIADGFGYEAGEEVANIIYNSNHRAEIYLVMSDVIAFGVVKQLLNLGVSIPQDIAIIGYDDIDFAKHFEPALSTIKQDTKMIGYTAAKRLLSVIEKPTTKKQMITKIPVKLVHRKTTKQ